MRSHLVPTLVAGAVVASALVAAGPAPSAHAAADPAPAAAGAAWLVDQIQEDGLLHDVSTFGDFPSYGGSIDAALALFEVPGHEGDATGLRDAVAGSITSYVESTEFPEEGEPVQGYYAGPTAKALAAAEQLGGDPESFGGVNLVERLETLTTPSGRIADESIYGDFANVIGQAFAARGLTDVASPEADAALDFLLDRQCPDGYFPLGFDEGCGDVPPVDTTALVVLQLGPLAAGDAVVASAVDAAVAWIADEQAANGSFATEVANTNTTGLAGWALLEQGEQAAAAKAATWIRGRQAVGLTCEAGRRREAGAVAFDNSALAAASGGIGEFDRSQWIIATSQSIVALTAAPEATGVLGAKTTAFVDGGGKAAVSVTGLAPGERACVEVKDRVVATGAGNGTATAQVPVPNKTAKVTVTLTTTDGTATATTQALGSKKLGLTLKKKVAAGKKQTVKVTGLVKGEKVTVKLGGKKVATGKAKANGSFTVTFKVGKKKGKATVTVTGQYADRKGAKPFRVV